MRNTGTSFVNVSADAGAPFNLPVAARGAACGDINNDGQIDVAVAVLNDSPVMLRNQGTKSGWIGFTLVGSKSNRQGIGARVTVNDTNGRKQVFDVSTSGSYLSANDPRIIAGLGTASGVKSVEVRWPSGRVQNVTNAQLRKYNVIKEADAGS